MQIAGNKWLTLIGVGLAAIIIAIDFTIVNTVMSDIQKTYSAEMNMLQWVMTGFGITFSAFLISMGRLSDIWGRRRMLYIGMVGFALASLGAGLAVSINQLIISRVLQGMFGAILFPAGMAITASSFPAHEQGKALGIYGSLLGIGLAAGPVLGGIITSLSNWRWIFLINLPVILFSFLMCVAVVKESRLQEKIAIDWWGVVYTTLGLGFLVFAITQSEVYGWFSPLIIACLFIAIGLFVALFFNEKKFPTPLLPPALFLNKSFFIGASIYVVCIGLTWTILFFIPLYLQNVLNFDVLHTGLLMLPMTGMTVLAPAIAGIMYDKEGPFITTMFAFAMSTLGLILFLFFSVQVSLSLMMIAFISIGLSWGVGNGIGVPIALSNPENKQHEGLVSGAAITVLNTAGVLFLSISSALFNAVQQNQIDMLYTKAAAFVGAFHAVIIFLLIVTLILFAAVYWVFKRV